MMGFAGFCMLYVATFVIAGYALENSLPGDNGWRWPFAAVLALMVSSGVLLVAVGVYFAERSAEK